MHNLNTLLVIIFVVVIIIIRISILSSSYYYYCHYLAKNTWGLFHTALTLRPWKLETFAYYQCIKNNKYVDVPVNRSRQHGFTCIIMLLFFSSILEITMTTHLIVAILCLGVASASLIDMLKAVHQNPSFKTLPQRSQILIIELIAETEAGEVKNYIDIVGFEKVISVIDSKYFRGHWRQHITLFYTESEKNMRKFLFTSSALCSQNRLAPIIKSGICVTSK